MPTQTREQKRAAAAWKCVNSLGNNVKPKDFAATCKKTSARILTAGLGGALAFLLAKDDRKRGDDRVAALIAEHCKANADASAFLRDLTKCDSSALRRHTDEALALLVWMARLADGKAKQEENWAGNQEQANAG